MRKENVLQRIEKIYDLLGRGHAMNTQQLFELMNEPKGTVSPFLSWMVRTGHLLKNNEGYLLTPFPSDPKKVAQDIRNLNFADRQRRIEQAKKFKTQRGLFEEPKSSEPKKLVSTWIGSHLQTDTEAADKITDAICLLKSYGYKVLKRTTEYKEV